MRFKKVLFILILILTISFLCISCTKSSNIEINQSQELLDISDEAYNYLTTISTTYVDRSCGNLAEDYFNSYIVGLMEEFGYSVEIKSFVEDFKGKTTTNIICKKIFNENNKKIVLGCQWDNSYSSSCVVDGAYESSCSIAALLTIARKLSTIENSNYNFEVIFFGAGTMNWDGAKNYLNGLSKNEKDNIALYINYAMLCGGDNLYAYSRDIKTEYNNLFMDVSNANNLGIKKVPLDKRVVDYTLSEDALYNYIHIGMLGNNYYFMNEKIPSVNYISINWEDKSYPAFVEKSKFENVFETKNDSLENMISRVGEKKIKDCFNNVVNSTICTIIDNQENLTKTLDNPKEVPLFGMSSAAYYVGLTIKILAVLVIVLILMLSRNYIKKNKDYYLEKAKASKEEREVFKEEILKVFNDDNNDDDDVFQ